MNELYFYAIFECVNGWPAGTRKKTTIKIAMITTKVTMKARIITRSC